MAKLVVITEGLTALSHELGDKWITIGRADDNAFQIAEASVSGRHCELLLQGEELVVRDLQSTNGTFVNGQKILETVMRPDQTLQVGEVELRFEPSPAGAPVVEANKVAPAEAGLEPARKFKVLFVDDSMAFLETFTELCEVFSNQTWGIECAASVDRALAILQETPVDLVVLDVRMPMVDGLQLLGIIHRRYPGMKIAVMTGNATESKRADALANGAESFIEKPVTPEGIKSVFNLLNDLVSWSRRESPGAAAPPPESVAAPLPEKTGEPVAPDDDFVVVATYDGKWNSVNKEK